MSSYYRRFVEALQHDTSSDAAMPGPLSAWLNAFPKTSEGFICLSNERRFTHDETIYDAQYNNDQSYFESGSGLIKNLKKLNVNFDLPAVEIGCGTGLLTLGLIKENAYPLLLATDPSSVFLKITQEKCRIAGLDTTRLALGLLDGSDIETLPPASLSLITLRSVLHHILDVNGFVAAASQALTPNGVLAFQEPCAEAFILMGGLAQFLPALAQSSGRPLCDEDEASVRLFLETVAFYCRRDIDKSEAEDKHCFRVEDVASSAEAAGLGMKFFPGVGFEGGRPDTFASQFRAYLKYCMSWREELLALFDEFLLPRASKIDEITAGGPPPPISGTFICRKLRAR